jgi:WD repeat-containing protein 23
MIPSSSPDTIINHDARCYSGQFSDDGNFFFSCSQDFQVRMYDTSNPYQWRYYKKVRYPSGRWTITDASLSPDNKYLAYSSITSVVCLAPTDPGVDTEPWMLDFSIRGTGGRNSQAFGYNSLFGVCATSEKRSGLTIIQIWSIRFSGDGKEIVAGTTDNSVYVYDLETRQSILEIPGHDDDVNAVCFGDKSSPHILYSGSDDATLKVWDRRSMGDGREAGVFIGHTEGLTYIDSKGDGRYVLSNSKDQTMKLWDLRKMVTAEKFDQLDSSYRRGIKDFDYRNDSYYEDEYVPDPNDCSVVTFRGHRVLKTLIRCHFSPPGSTNSRYVYTGSRDGIVYIYNLDGTLAGKVNVNDATRGTRPQNRNRAMYYGFEEDDMSSWVTCVRDASWHPTAPVIAGRFDPFGLESLLILF